MMNAVHPESSMNRPDALPFEPFQDAVAAVDRRRSAAIPPSCARSSEVLEDAGAGKRQVAGPGLLPGHPHPCRDLRPHRHAPVLWPRGRTRHLPDHDHPAGAVSRLPDRTGRTAAAEPPRGGRGGRVGLAHSLHFAFPEGAYVEGGTQAPAARSVRRARPGRDRRRHRQRLLARTASPAAGALHRAARGLLAAPAAALRRPRPRISRTSCCSRTTSSTSTSSAPALAP